MKYLPVRYSPGNQPHQFPVFHCVEVLFQIDILNFLTAPVKIFIYFPYRSVCAFHWSEPITRLCKISFKYWLQYYQKCCLHDAIPNGWNAQWSLLSVGFRNIYPLYWSWFVLFFFQFLLKFC